MPSIQMVRDNGGFSVSVLNLVISGMPSILHKKWLRNNFILCFKPCYKWNAFNTMKEKDSDSIKLNSFKPCYKWNAFNTEATG